jgi:hypothetical protein
MIGDEIEREALHGISMYGRKLAAQMMKSGQRKGVGLDGKEISITITIPAEGEKAEMEECGSGEECATEGPMRRKMREFGISED